MKKANKLVRLLIEVERALNSAEAAEIASQSDPSLAAQYMKDAGLRFLPEPPPPPPPPAEEDSSTNSTVAAGTQEDNDGGAADGSTSTRVSPARRPGEKSSTGLGETATRRRRAAAAAGAGSATGSSASGAEGPGVSGGAGGAGGQRKKKKKKRAKSKEGGVPGAAAAGAAAAGGEPLEAFVVTVAGCEVRCFLMLDERGVEDGEGRLVVAVGDSLTGEALLESLFEEPAVVQLASHGLMRETAYVNRVAFQVHPFLVLPHRDYWCVLCLGLRDERAGVGSKSGGANVFC